MDDSWQRLQRRIAELDAPDRPWATSPGSAGLLEHAVAVLATRTGDPEPPSAALMPAAADELVVRCRLLAELGDACASIVAGPIDRDQQQWVSTARHVAPARNRVRPIAASSQPKPFGMGLHTSTAGPDGRSSWRVYLEPYRGSDLHPLPWTGWRLPVRPEARIREVTSARQWVDLVAEYPAAGPDGLVPDWPAVAADHDSLHLTTAAVVAVQGLRLQAPVGITAPVWWDVESTFWFRWCFDVACRDVVGDG